MRNIKASSVLKESETCPICNKMINDSKTEKFKLMSNIELGLIRSHQYVDGNNKDLKVKIFRIVSYACRFSETFRDDFEPFAIKCGEKNDYSYEELMPYIKKAERFYPYVVGSIEREINDYAIKHNIYADYEDESFTDFIFFLTDFKDEHMERYFVRKVLDSMNEEKERLYYEKTPEQQKEIQEAWKKCYMVFRNDYKERLRDSIKYEPINVISNYFVTGIDLVPLYDLIKQ